MKRRQHAYTFWLVATDLAAALAAYGLAFALRFHSGIFQVARGVPDFGPYAALLPWVVVLWPIFFAIQRLYRPTRGRSLIDEAFSLSVGAALATLLLFGVDAYYRLYYQAQVPVESRFTYSRGFILLFVLLDIVLTVAGRFAVRRSVAAARRRGLNARRVLIVGAGQLGRRVARRMLDHPDYGFHIVGFLDDDPAKQGAIIEGLKVLGPSAQVEAVVERERPEELVLALPWSAHDRMLELLEATSRTYLEVKVVPDLLDYIAIRAGLEDLDGLPILNLSDDPLHAWDWALKRAFDVAASAFGLILLAPLFGLIALLVRRSSPGPVLYPQERLGLDGKRFIMYKFRTMRVDAEAHTGPVFAADVDPRSTPLGHWLRRLSLDELPQLWNVLKGDMSIVGPRPERPSFVSQFKEKIPQYMYRHRMKSGMTGWAQVNGWRGNTSIPKRIEHDLYYLANWSLALDLKIVWLTLLRSFR